VFEVIIANALNHELIPGHSGSRDAKDSHGIYEYKHYKETSSNHSWTFNDYTDNTISKLKTIKAVIFAHIHDSRIPIIFDWYYKVPGNIISTYLSTATAPIRNNRKMINVSPRQIEQKIGLHRTIVRKQQRGKYTQWIGDIFSVIRRMENICSTKGLLTSNKFWEVLTAAELNHNVLSEQGGRAGAHDAIDANGNFYEYKVAKSFSWNFQDISDKVLQKYHSDKAIILAVVDKNEYTIKKLYSVDSKIAVPYLKDKLTKKKLVYKQKGKELRRKQVSLNRSDLEPLQATQII